MFKQTYISLGFCMLYFVLPRYVCFFPTYRFYRWNDINDLILRGEPIEWPFQFQAYCNQCLFSFESSHSAWGFWWFRHPRPPGLLFIDPVLYLIGQPSNLDWLHIDFYIFPVNNLINHVHDSWLFFPTTGWAMIFSPKELSLNSCLSRIGRKLQAILFLESNSSVVTYSSVPWPKKPLIQSVGWIVEVALVGRICSGPKTHLFQDFGGLRIWKTVNVLRF